MQRFSLIRTIFSKLGRQNRRPTIHSSAVIFLDNRFSDFFGQIEHLFSSGFLPPDTVIISRFRLTNFHVIQAAAYSFGMSVRYFTTLSTLPKLAPGTIVIYPYNGQANTRVMLNRECTHVFVGHGDSNKKASCNPLLRAYDYVLTAGELSRQRLIDQGILRPSHQQDHTISVGNTILDTRQGRNYVYRSCAAGGIIGYFPTWEGGFEAENYSSIAEKNTVGLIVSLCESQQTKSVFVDPHPNVGTRDHRYTECFVKLVQELIDRGIKVNCPDIKRKPKVLKPLRRFLNSGKLSFTDDRIGLCLAIVDVSAAEANLTMQGIPTAVMLNGKAKLYASSRYKLIRASSLITINDDHSCEAIIEKFRTDELANLQIKFQSECISYDDPEIKHLAPSDRWRFLANKYFCKSEQQLYGRDGRERSSADDTHQIELGH